jgi:hypothetical protein
MGLLDYIEDNWRDSYRPFTRYPEIYGEHLEQGKGLLTEEGQGWSSLYKKPMGLLNISGIPALYEAFRDEPIRDNLINAGMDSDKAGYATQAIGTALDIGVPWAVMKKGMTPWMSEYAASKANPASKVNAPPSDPSRRRFIKGAAGAAALAAGGKYLPEGTGVQAVKQAAKSVPTGFAGLLTKMNTSLKSIGVSGVGKPLISKSLAEFDKAYGRLAAHLGFSRGRHIDTLTAPFRGGDKGKEWDNVVKQYHKDYPSESSAHVNAFVQGKEPTGAKIAEEGKSGQQHIVPDHIEATFARLERARMDYKADPAGFTNGMNSKIKELRGSITQSRISLSQGPPIPKTFGGKPIKNKQRFKERRVRQIEDQLEQDTELLSQMEQFLKELQGG